MIYNILVKRVLTCWAETWILYEDGRSRINTTEMDTLRRSARISKLDGKTNECIRGGEKNESARYGIRSHNPKTTYLLWPCRQNGPNAITKNCDSLETWRKKKLSSPRRTWKDGIFTTMGERELRMGEWNNQGQWNMEVGRRRQTFKISAIYVLTYLFIYLLTYLLHGAESYLEKLTGLQLVKKFPAFHGTRRFITALTSVRHLSLSWASPIQSIYTHPTSWRSILILSTHLRLGLLSVLLPSGFPSKTLWWWAHSYPKHAEKLK